MVNEKDLQTGVNEKKTVYNSRPSGWDFFYL